MSNSDNDKRIFPEDASKERKPFGDTVLGEGMGCFLMLVGLGLFFFLTGLGVHMCSGG